MLREKEQVISALQTQTATPTSYAAAAQRRAIPPTSRMFKEKRNPQGSLSKLSRSTKSKEVVKLRCTTVTAGTTALQKLSSVGDHVQAKRKYKSVGGGKVTKWWFVLRGGDDKLRCLRVSGNLFHYKHVGA